MDLLFIVINFQRLLWHPFCALLLFSDILCNDFAEGREKVDCSSNENQYLMSTEEVLLSEMASNFNQNVHRSPRGYRYSEEIKLYTAHERMIGGKMAYETFKANAKRSVPSVRSVNRYISRVKSSAIEGVLRTKEFSEYLTVRNLPRVVALSEDATRITDRIQFDRETNQLVGFVLTIGENGMPITGQKKALSAAAMEKCFYDVKTGAEKKRSTYLNVVMAQPLVSGIPPFCLLLFGSDTKYTSAQIKKRWEFIAEELKKENIEVLTFASDSDPKFNSVMRDVLGLLKNRENNIDFPEWFNSITYMFYPIQDIIHIGTKFRNRLLVDTLKMGKYDIKVHHLLFLIEEFTKEKHNLCATTVNPKDRQNFESVLKICDDKVIDLLANVDGSEGTVLYLRILSSILRSFLDPSLTPIQRIRHIWFATFVLRIWKTFILESEKKYNVSDHFISQNCYVCVEINAHSIVHIMVQLREKGLDHLFLPLMFGSQQCESIFRQIRSMTSTYSTVTNCSLLEIVNRISKIELQNEIMHVKCKRFNFPRLGVQSSTYYPRLDRNGVDQTKVRAQLPSQQDIIKEIELAKLEAIEYAESLGMRVKIPTNHSCVIPKPKRSRVEQSNAGISQSETAIATQDEDILQLFGGMDLTQYAEKIDPNSIDVSGPYVKVKNRNGKILCIQKHTLCWLLSKTTTKLSSDRTIRVMTKQK